MSYLIKKVLNNNIVQCCEMGKSDECLLLGKGIGFQKKADDLVDDEKVEKIYHIRNEKNLNRYQKLVNQCDERLVVVVEDVIHMMEERFGNLYDEYLHIALLDHLNFSLYRLQNGIEVKNIFLEEFSVMYADEYAFAQMVLSYINQQLSIQLPASEIGFITLHIHSALHKESVSKSTLYMQIITSCINLIEDKLKVKLDAGSIERMRLVTHLKFALERADKKIEIHNPLLDSLKTAYPETYEIANSMREMMKIDYLVELSDGEIGYLVLHIQNIIMGLSK